MGASFNFLVCSDRLLLASTESGVCETINGGRILREIQVKFAVNSALIVYLYPDFHRPLAFTSQQIS
jgi:hypothetical protein